MQFIQSDCPLISVFQFNLNTVPSVDGDPFYQSPNQLVCYEAAKSTGEVQDVFKFTYEDRPYICLSGSERIRAGLEVAELVKGLIRVDYPMFIDDAERVPVIDNVRPSGQIFIATVAKGVKLTV